MRSIETQCCINFRLQHCDLRSICYACHRYTCVCHLQQYYNIIDYMLYALPFIPATYSFHQWKPISPTLLPSFFPSPHPLLSGNHQLVSCICRSDSAFVYSFFFGFYMSEIIWYLFVFVSLAYFTLHNTP